MKMDGWWSSMGSLMALMMFVRSLAREFIPDPFYIWWERKAIKFLRYFNSQVTLVFEQETDGFRENELYDAVQSYLSDRSCEEARNMIIRKPKNSRDVSYSAASNEEITDVFRGVTLRWVFRSTERKQPPSLSSFFRSTSSDEKRDYRLTFHAKHKSLITKDYLTHITMQAKAADSRRRQRRIFTNAKDDSRWSYSGRRMWIPVPFDHPSCFDTLALDPTLKAELLADLDKFRAGESYYRRVGRAWKRGYLLYGPPGTGKSSMIAAMANYMDYDIYDLELTEVKNNAMLRKLLINTTNKSIIVIEDIDCSLDLNKREGPKKKETDAEDDEKKALKKKMGEDNEESKVTLSGVLNFTDGLWSCCGSERIFVFTTNHVERLDPALLRPGRMDKHIHLSFCRFGAFKALVRSYLDVEDHSLFEQVEELIEDAQMTPADVAEHLMKNSHDPTAAISSVIVALRESVKKKAEESKGEGEVIVAECLDKEEEEKGVSPCLCSESDAADGEKKASE